MSGWTNAPSFPTIAERDSGSQFVCLSEHANAREARIEGAGDDQLAGRPGRLVPRLPVAASTVCEAIDALDALRPGVRDRLCDSTPRIRRHINVFVGGERAALKTSVMPGAEIVVLTAISGG